jgi:hypothetical protein
MLVSLINLEKHHIHAAFPGRYIFGVSQIFQEKQPDSNKIGLKGNKVRLRESLPNSVFDDRIILLREVEGTPHTFSSSVEDVHIDHRRGDIPVPQQLLYRPNIVPFLQKVGRERMPKGMACDPFGESGTGGGLLHGLLDHRFVQIHCRLASGYFLSSLYRKCNVDYPFLQIFLGYFLWFSWGIPRSGLPLVL